ncbi:MAG TPA: hypothetical protein VH951_00675 [Dehalococcoidia bacterium]
MAEWSSAVWVEDLDFLRREFPARHKNAFHSLSEAEFHAGMDALVAEAPRRQRREHIVGLTRLLARVGDGHSGIDLGQAAAGFSHLPLRFYLYREGLHVSEARPGLADVAGARVVAVGGVDAEEAVRRAGELANHDNEMGMKAAVSKILAMPEVLHALGLGKSSESTHLTLTTADQRTRTVEIGADQNPTAGGWVYGGGAGVPLWRRHRERAYWFEILPERRLAYAQLNRVTDDPEEPFAAFCSRLLAAMAGDGVQRLVIDLRLNGGGNGYLNQALVHSIIRSDSNERGRLFVITGRATFSAALMCTVDFERETQAVFVGEPGSGRPNHYSESGRFTLPNSGIVVGYSWLYWQLSDARDERACIAPHIEAEPSAAADFAGRDPAMEAILEAIESGFDFAALPSNRLRWAESAKPFLHHYG